MQNTMKLGEAIYKASQAGDASAEPAPESATSENGEKVVDAEYEEVKEEKKDS